MIHESWMTLGWSSWLSVGKSGGSDWIVGGCPWNDFKQETWYIVLILEEFNGANL